MTEIRQRVVCYITRGKRELLVFEHDDPALQAGVQVVAGGIDEGETPAEAAIREALEEAGLTLSNPVFLGSIDKHWPDAKNPNQHWHFYWLEAPIDTPDAWDHTVTAGEDDMGMVYRQRFVKLEDVKLDWDLEAKQNTLFAKLQISDGILFDDYDKLNPDFLPISDEIRNFLRFCDTDQSVVAAMPELVLRVNNSFNAKAGKLGELEFISLNTGTIIILRKLFRFMMSLPDILPDIGEPKEDQDCENRIFTIPDQLWHLNSIDKSSKCVKRSQYANYLFKIGLLFMVGHEISHIRRGHFALLTKNNVLDESVFSHEGINSDRELIEIDADSTSISLVLLYLRYINHNIEREMPHFWVFSDRKKLFKLTYFSINVVSFVFQSDWSWKINEKRRYPPPTARGSIIRYYICESALEFFGMSTEEIIESASESYNLSENAIDRISDKEVYESLKKQYSEIKDSLESYFISVPQLRNDLSLKLGSLVRYKNIV
jgi:8-oxo-dGTP diphosphatase